MKTISIPEDLHKEIMQLRLQKGNKNTAELIRQLVLTYKEKRFLEASKLFNDKLKKSGKSFEQFLKEAKKIREEIADEWF